MSDHPPKAARAQAGPDAARPSDRRTSIVDVAALAGVSRQTVSNVLNGRREYFSEDTYVRVTAAMRELGYQPNRAAQSLRSRRTMQLGYPLPGEHQDAASGVPLLLLQALVTEAAGAGYHILPLPCQGDPLDALRDVIARRGVDGFILSDSGVDDPRVPLLAEHGMPFVGFGRTGPGVPQAWVDVHDAAGMREMVDYLVSAGHRRLAYVDANGGEHRGRERRAGFVAGLAAHGLTAAAGAIASGSNGDVRDHIRRMLRGADRPSAIVTSSDAVAAVVVNVSHAQGVRVGEDVAVTGFGGGTIGQLTEPTLTTMRIPVELVARSLLDRLRREMTTGPTGEPGVLVPTTLVRGGSA